MDDRILVIPPIWAPDVPTIRELASIRVLLERLKDLLPLDIFSGPPLRGAALSVSGWQGLAAAYQETIRPQHHILSLSALVEVLLVALSRRSARSLATTTIYVSPATAEAAGDPSLAAGMRGALEIMIAGSRHLIPILLEGAEPKLVTQTVERVDSTIDRAALVEIVSSAMKTDALGKVHVDIPVLQLLSVAPMTSAGPEVLGRFASNVRTAQMTRWAMRLHEEDSGHELADKMIPFIQEVIAAREKR